MRHSGRGSYAPNPVRVDDWPGSALLSCFWLSWQVGVESRARTPFRFSGAMFLDLRLLRKWKVLLYRAFGSPRAAKGESVILAPAFGPK
jgi:hypothetical protein